jgi:hypothetical protein
VSLPRDGGTRLFSRLIHRFRPNLTDTASLPQTDVKVRIYHNIYVYAARRLCIAYSVALACATIVVALGLYAIITNGASYSNEFSTILRVSRHALLDHEVSPGATDGRDPLPEDLAKATLMVVKKYETDSSSVEQQSAAAANDRLLPPG